MIEFCSQCGASLSADAEYCGECGQQDVQRFRRQAKARKAQSRDLRRRGIVTALIFLGTLTGLIVASAIATGSPLAGAMIGFGFDLTLGALALLLLGRSALRHALGRLPGLRDLVLVLPVTAFTFAIASGYVALLVAMGAGEGALPTDDDEFLALVLAAVVFAPIAEEWLCRGALWVAIRPVTDRTTAILATAVLFAFLHGLNGFLPIELPHRFVMGLALGWLRARTASLTPCVLAHALHNLLAVVL